jgi:hypothetical protein
MGTSTSKRLLTVAVAIALTTSVARAAVIEGVEFADSLRQPGADLLLHNTAVFRWKLFFKPYVAALYLADPADAAEVLADVPKRLELSYFYSIKGPDFAMAADELLARNLAPQALARLRPSIDALNALYRDVEPGDRYALTYLPGRGTELALNGLALGVVPGAEFAAAYFSIWLGEVPLDDALKQQLLARR